MEASLRLILIVLGVLVIVGAMFDAWRRKSKANKRRNNHSRIRSSSRMHGIGLRRSTRMHGIRKRARQQRGVSNRRQSQIQPHARHFGRDIPDPIDEAVADDESIQENHDIELIVAQPMAYPKSTIDQSLAEVTVEDIEACQLEMPIESISSNLCERIDTDSMPSIESEQLTSDNTDIPPVFVIYVVAKSGGHLPGLALLENLLVLGMRFGEMQIFHRHEQHSGHGPVLFSLASATEPGIFQLDQMTTKQYQGLSLFMQLDDQQMPEYVYDLMVKTAQDLAAAIDALLCDADQQPLTEARIADNKALIRRHVDQAELVHTEIV